MFSARVKKVMRWTCYMPILCMVLTTHGFGQTKDVDLINTTELISYDYHPRLTGLYHNGDRLIVNTFNGEIFNVNVSDSATPVSLGNMWLPGMVSDLAIEGDTIYLAAYEELLIYDISDFDNPVVLYDKSDNFILPYVYGLFLKDQYLVAAVKQSSSNSTETDLIVYDVTDPANPKVVNSVEVPLGDLVYIKSGFLGSLKGNDQYLALKSNINGLRIYDATALPELRELCYLPDVVASDVTFSGNQMVVGLYDHLDKNYPKGIRVYDNSDPTSPVLQGAYDTDEDVYSLEADGSLSYAANLGEGLRILIYNHLYSISGITDPANPAVVGQYVTPESAIDVALNQGYAYVSVNQIGVQVLEYTGPRPKHANNAVMSDWWFCYE